MSYQGKVSHSAKNGMPILLVISKTSPILENNVKIVLDEGVLSEYLELINSLTDKKKSTNICGIRLDMMEIETTDLVFNFSNKKNRQMEDFP